MDECSVGGMLYTISIHVASSVGPCGEHRLRRACEANGTSLKSVVKPAFEKSVAKPAFEKSVAKPM